MIRPIVYSLLYCLALGVFIGAYATVPV